MITRRKPDDLEAALRAVGVLAITLALVALVCGAIMVGVGLWWVQRVAS